jgi:hypothetical protein
MYLRGPSLDLAQALIQRDSASGDLTGPTRKTSLRKFAVMQSANMEETIGILRTLIAAGAD